MYNVYCLRRVRKDLVLERIESEEWIVSFSQEIILAHRQDSSRAIITLRQYAYIKQGWRMGGGRTGRAFVGLRLEEFNRRCSEIFLLGK